MNERHTSPEATLEPPPTPRLPATDQGSDQEPLDQRPRVRLARGRPDIVAALRDARGLLDEVGAPFCAQPLWLSAWYANAASDATHRTTPLAVVVRQQGTTVALASLALRRTGLLRTVTLAGDGPSDYGRLPARDERAAAALADGILGVLANLRGPWQLRLAQLPVGDPVVGLLLDVLPGARVLSGQPCPAMAFGADRAPERHLAAKGRRAARRCRARLDEAGVRVEVERISDPIGVRTLLPEIVDLHRARDRALGRRSDLDRPSRRGFYVDVVRGLADRGQLDIWVLRLDGALGAFVIGVRDRTSYRALDARIADLWPSASPGQVLRTEMITQLLADPGLTELDWLRGELRHKMQDASHVVATEHLLAESSPTVASALRRWHGLRQEMRDRIPIKARQWLRSRALHGGLTGLGPRFRVGRAGPDAAPVAPRPPGAADDSPEPS